MAVRAPESAPASPRPGRAGPGRDGDRPSTAPGPGAGLLSPRVLRAGPGPRGSRCCGQAMAPRPPGAAQRPRCAPASSSQFGRAGTGGEPAPEKPQARAGDSFPVKLDPRTLSPWAKRRHDPRWWKAEKSLNFPFPLLFAFERGRKDSLLCFSCFYSCLRVKVNNCPENAKLLITNEILVVIPWKVFFSWWFSQETLLFPVRLVISINSCFLLFGTPLLSGTC